ncbi:MAG: nucleoside hydrolase [Erysipelotrichaceae bacterium]|nr:nucleoside hydrolase [Erysipelotrichaceae bacterium]
MKKIPVWIDTDCGVDDAMALLLAFRLPELEIVGLSAVAGNVTLENTFRNTRDIAALAGRKDIPVYKGADRPWIVEPRRAEYVHGADGLGGAEIAHSDAPEAEGHAWDALYQCAKKYPGELQVVAVGPLTDVANAVIKYPDLPQYVKGIHIMGGVAAGPGNTNMTAEFNIMGDPHAAACVFKSGIPVTMAGLDVTLKAHLNKEEVEAIASTDNKVCKLISQATRNTLALYKQLGLGEIMCMHDSCPILNLAHPEFFSGKEAGVHVETTGVETLGKTVCDLYSDGKHGVKNTTVLLDCDREAIVKLVSEIYTTYEA